jgi:aldehyde dehydrogenase (NAD+)
MGAIVAPVQLERIKQLVETGQKEGAAMWQPSWAVPREGCFYPPTLFTDVFPSSTIAQVEIFGPVLVSMTFRTPEESVALANNTPYGLAASVWTENINLALDIAPKIKAGVVWVNCTNLFDASSGFGGYRESGFGREGGREGMFEYLKRGHRSQATGHRSSAEGPARNATLSQLPDGGVDRTAKLFIGGKQARPDSGYSRMILSPKGKPLGEVGEGNRKDIRNAVEAAHAAKGWARSSGHLRGQVLYYIGENLTARRDEFAGRISAMTGASKRDALREVDASVRRLFTYAAWADKWDGAVHSVPIRGVALAMNEPIGVVGAACPDESPLLGFISLVAPLIATGNTVIAIPSEAHPLAATDLYQVFETSDLPPGVVNIVTGSRDTLAKVLAEHDDVEAMWYCGSDEGVKMVELASASNMKRTWCPVVDWLEEEGEGREFLREAVQVKNIWIPYGE